MSDPVSSAPANLQFDRAVPGAPGAPGASAGVACGACGKLIKDYYYSRAGVSICTSCKLAVERLGDEGRKLDVLARALTYGLGAALAGAAVYYAVIAMFNLEIGIVAILIGYMVGRAIRAAHPAANGRRYQILAVVLVYFAVGMAYVPLLVTAARQHAQVTARAHKAAAAAQAPAPTDSGASSAGAAGVAAPSPKPASTLTIVVGIIIIAFALPILAIFSSASGVITALIIGIGMQRAWRMTAGVARVPITGPLRLGGATAAG